MRAGPFATLPEEQVREQEVPEVIHGERDLVAVRREPRARRHLEPGVADERAEAGVSRLDLAGERAERQAFLARVAARDPSLANVLRAEVDLDERPVASTASHLTLQSPQWEIPTAVAPVAQKPANTMFPADSILHRRDSGWIFPSDSILRRGGNDWIFPAGSILNHNP